MKYNLPQIYRNLEKNTMQTNHLCKTLQSNNKMKKYNRTWILLFTCWFCFSIGKFNTMAVTYN